MKKLTILEKFHPALDPLESMLTETPEINLTQINNRMSSLTIEIQKLSKYYDENTKIMVKIPLG